MSWGQSSTPDLAEVGQRLAPMMAKSLLLHEDTTPKAATSCDPQTERRDAVAARQVFRGPKTMGGSQKLATFVPRNDPGSYSFPLFANAFLNLKKELHVNQALKQAVEYLMT